MDQEPPILSGLFRRRQCILPTWRGWLLFLVLGAAAITFAIRGAYYFLAINDPVPSRNGILVVEGWGDDAFMEYAISEFHRGHYEQLFATGGPLDKGSMFAKYKTYAEFSVASLIKLGFDPALVHAIPAQEVCKDRTYASAVALRKWIESHGMKVTSLNLFSEGCHSRRSRLLFQKAFGDTAKVGIIAYENPEFDPDAWWTTSNGFRTVTGEMIAYIYARFLFHPPANQ